MKSSRKRGCIVTGIVLCVKNIEKRQYWTSSSSRKLKIGCAVRRLEKGDPQIVGPAIKAVSVYGNVYWKCFAFVIFDASSEIQHICFGLC